MYVVPAVFAEKETATAEKEAQVLKDPDLAAIPTLLRMAKNEGEEIL